MKESTTSSSHKRGDMYKGSGHSSQADILDKWGHDGYDSILHEEKEMEKSQHSKKSQDWSSSDQQQYKEEHP